MKRYFSKKINVTANIIHKSQSSQKNMSKKSCFFSNVVVCASYSHDFFFLSFVGVILLLVMWRLLQREDLRLYETVPLDNIEFVCEEGQDHMARDRLYTYFPHLPQSFGFVLPRNLFNRHQARRTGLCLSGAPREGR